VALGLRIDTFGDKRSEGYPEDIAQASTASALVHTVHPDEQPAITTVSIGPMKRGGGQVAGLVG